MRPAARKVAKAIVKAKRTPGFSYRTARVTSVNAGPPSLDLLIEDRWAAYAVPYHDHIDTPAIDDEVHVVTYGTGRRVVVGRVQT